MYRAVCLRPWPSGQPRAHLTSGSGGADGMGARRAATALGCGVAPERASALATGVGLGRYGAGAAVGPGAASLEAPTRGGNLPIDGEPRALRHAHTDHLTAARTCRTMTRLSFAGHLANRLHCSWRLLPVALRCACCNGAWPMVFATALAGQRPWGWCLASAGPPFSRSSSRPRWLGYYLGGAALGFGRGHLSPDRLLDRRWLGYYLGGAALGLGRRHFLPDGLSTGLLAGAVVIFVGGGGLSTVGASTSCDAQARRLAHASPGRAGCEVDSTSSSTASLPVGAGRPGRREDLES